MSRNGTARAHLDSGHQLHLRGPKPGGTSSTCGARNSGHRTPSQQKHETPSQQKHIPSNPTIPPLEILNLRNNPFCTKLAQTGKAGPLRQLDVWFWVLAGFGASLSISSRMRSSAQPPGGSKRLVLVGCCGAKYGEPGSLPMKTAMQYS